MRTENNIRGQDWGGNYAVPATTPPAAQTISSMQPQTSVNLHEASAQWRSRPADERYTTLADLRAAVHARRCRSRSIDVDRQDLAVQENSNGQLIVNSTISACEPSHWAFGQLCAASRINGVSAPANYLRQLPTPLAVQCLNQGLQSGDRESHKFMTIAREEPDSPAILQAVTSTSYGRIWDADVVDRKSVV